MKLSTLQFTYTMLRLLSPMRKDAFSFKKTSVRTLMTAIRIHEFGGPEVLQVERVPEPVERDNEVLVEVKAAGINPVDTYIRQGDFKVLPPLPAILGKEVSGIVKSTGSNVKNFKIGDRVYCCLPNDGGYAEVISCSENNTFPLSDRLSFAQGSALYVAYFTAYRALVTKCSVQKNNMVFIHGASGPVGIAAIQIAKHMGATVMGTAGSPGGKAAAETAGADFVFNHRLKNYLDEIRHVTERRGFDVIVENVAHLNLAHDLRILAPKGRLAIVGSRGEVMVRPRDLMFTEGTVTGVQLACISREEMKETASVLEEGANSGWVNPIIEKEFNFDEAVEAHRKFLSRRARGKLLFVVN